MTVWRQDPPVLWQAVVYGLTMPPQTHVCTDSEGTLRIVHWKQT